MAKRFQRRERKFLGFGAAKAIRGFFGANALFSIAILALICLFLMKEAFMFFPSHHEELKLYRKSGQEFVGHIKDQVDGHTELNSLVAQAYFAELDHTVGRERGLLDAYAVLIELGEDLGEDEIDEWADARDDLEDAQDDDKEAALATATEAERKAATAWNEKLQSIIDGEGKEEAFSCDRFHADDWDILREAMSEWDPVEEIDPPLIEETDKIVRTRLSKFSAAKDQFAASIAPLRSLREKLRMLTMKIKDEAIADRSAAARKAAIEEGLDKIVDPEQRQKKKEEAENIVIREHFPFEERTKPVYGSIDDYQKASADYLPKFQAALEGLPTAPASPRAEALLRTVREDAPSFLRDFAKHEEKALAWKHDSKVSMPGSIGAFFFGLDWITNSSWHDFFGLMPLLTGSLLISIVALVVAVPFAVAAAVYTNQLASPLEQGVVKPTIEFVQAIPSVVLGFFGIMVLGSGLREISQIESLSWIPGFPMQERLNILNAGLLLALMAVPTIFTLCEDALNNVPKAFTDASLALGASKLQTVMRVVAPAAISGILAAVLLGFGRVIGETMVVLLVAGNKIAIPDFSQGLGVLTQPAHTMTGIIAQETGEVVKGSLHWRALFMVGLILFLISLSINYLAQRVIEKFHYR